MHPQTTILITCFDKEHSIQKTIESALNQSIDKALYEVLVIDDASTDNSVNEISKMNGIVLHENCVNQGVLQSVFIGLEKAKGEIIILLDGDDLLASNAVEILSEFLLKNPNCAVYSKCKRFDDRDIELHRKPIENYKVIRTFNQPMNISRFNKTGTSTLAFYKNDLLSHKNNVPPVLIQDHIIPPMLACNVNKFFFIDALTHIMINWDSDTHITSNSPQLEHDRIEFFWQCVKAERIAGSRIFDFYFRMILLKKIYKRNKKFKLNVPLGFSKMLHGFMNIIELETIKNETMNAFRENYKIKYYG